MPEFLKSVANMTTALEHVEHAKELLRRAKDEDSVEAAWKLVDYVYDQMLLEYAEHGLKTAIELKK